VFEPHGLEGKSEEDLVCADDAAGADFFDAAGGDVEAFGDAFGGAGDAGLGFEMLLDDFDVGVRGDFLRTLEARMRKLMPMVMLGDQRTAVRRASFLSSMILPRG